MKCKFCGKEAKLIKAHIIPKGFFKRLKHQDNTILQMLTNIKGEFSKRSPVGVYDKKIVCADCEQIWEEWDHYAQNLLVEAPSRWKPIHNKKNLIAYEIEEYDYTKLKLFFISVLWRASVSEQNFFSRITLGNLEDNLKELITHRDPGTREDFNVVLSYFDHPLAKTIMDPYIYYTIGTEIKYARFYFGNFIADIKVDIQNTPIPYSQISLSENPPLLLMCRDFTSSHELTIIQDLIRHTEETKR